MPRAARREDQARRRLDGLKRLRRHVAVEIDPHHPTVTDHCAASVRRPPARQHADVHVGAPPDVEDELGGGGAVGGGDESPPHPVEGPPAQLGQRRRTRPAKQHFEVDTQL
jgi:hypothetical protein